MAAQYFLPYNVNVAKKFIYYYFEADSFYSQSQKIGADDGAGLHTTTVL